MAELTWSDGISSLFSEPYWIEGGSAERRRVGQLWKQCMDGYAIDLSSLASVREWAVTIHDHLASGSMPMTSDDSQLWPSAAIDQLRTWINQGCRESPEEPIRQRDLIPPPPQPPGLRVRRNILDLTQAELDEYRRRVEDLGVADSSPTSAWQQLGNLHTEWCLHYQEAFLLWHRANLLYFEAMIDFPVPYWDFMAPDATVDGSPRAGIPQPFKDLTYIHPQTGEERPNPLRFAAARGGRSKGCTGQDHDAPEECFYVQRDPVLYSDGADYRAQREAKLELVAKFQEQVALALSWPVFSTPQGWPGYPWANIQTFDPPPPDSEYPHRCDFDGLYEQPHDNFHGWVGPDMADNTYTCYDPIFWSYHSNIDRIFEEWARAHPAAQFTASFPLRPFVGPLAETLEPASPFSYCHTTIGDMASDSRRLGYDYPPPGTTFPISDMGDEDAGDHLYIVFEDVKCIHDTYTIDVFLNLPGATPPDKHNANKPHYVGRQTRLGMGIVDDKGRCVSRGVTRILDASRTARLLQVGPESEIRVDLVVTEAHRDRIVGPEEYLAFPGFQPTWVWGRGRPSPERSWTCS
jgi:tyrosinase